MEYSIATMVGSLVSGLQLSGVSNCGKPHPLTHNLADARPSEDDHSSRRREINACPSPDRQIGFARWRKTSQRCLWMRLIMFEGAVLSYKHLHVLRP